MKKSKLLIAVLFISGVFCFAQSEGGIHQSEANELYSKLLLTAIENNYDIQVKKIALREALGQYYQAKATTEFTLGADTNIEVTEPQKSNSSSIGASVYLQKLFSFGLNTRLTYSMKNQKADASTSYNSGTIALELQLPIFKSFKNSITQNQIDKARLYLNSLEYSLEDSLSQTIIKISKEYFNVIIQQYSLKQIDLIKKNLEEQIKGMDALIEAGVRSKNDLLEMTVNIEEYESMILTRQAELTQLVSELSISSGVSIEEIMNNLPDYENIYNDMNVLASVKEISLSDDEIKEIVLQSSDVISLEKTVESAKAYYRIARANQLPDLNLNFGIGSTGSVISNNFGDFFASPYKNVCAPNLMGSLSFKMGLERLDAKGQIEITSAEVAKAELDYSTLIKQKSQNIKNTIMLLNKYRTYTLKARMVLDMNEELYTNQRKRFKAGLITVTELYNQDEKHLNAHSNYIKILTNYFIQVLNYKYYTNNFINLTSDELNSVSTRLFSEE